MFNETIKTLNKLGGGTSLSIDVELDDDGCFERECKKCDFLFKVKCEDWKNLFKDEEVHCPLCAHKAPSTEWNTEDQTNRIRSNAQNFLSNLLGNAVANDARRFNARQKPSAFLSMEIEARGFPKHYYKMPLKATQRMELKIQCEQCSACYAVIGSAFFCPCCGFNSVENTIDNSLRKISESVSNIEKIETSIAEVRSKDEAANICRSIVENSISEAVSCYQAYCDAIYHKITGQHPAKNLFQRVTDGSSAWQAAIGNGYEDWLDASELEKLTLYFQRRHILTHKNGIVDNEYLQKSSDKNYATGQRIVVKPSNVTEFVFVLIKLVSSIRQTIDNQKYT